MADSAYYLGTLGSCCVAVDVPIIVKGSTESTEMPIRPRVDWYGVDGYEFLQTAEWGFSILAGHSEA